MEKYNKIVVASKMFVESHNRYVSAKEDIDYIVSILLSGAVVGIIAPLLKEQGGYTTHELFAKISNALAEAGIVETEDGEAHEGMFRAIYNSLKHAGKERKGAKLKPSDDMEIETNLKLAAEHMLDAAKNDFKKIDILGTIRNDLSKEFIGLLGSSENYI